MASCAFRTLSWLMGSRVNSGGLPLSVMPCVALPVLPAASVTETEMLWLPSPSAPMTEAGTPTLQLPSAWTAPVKVLPPTVTVTMSPSAAPFAWPEIICACPCSLVFRMSSPATVLIVTTGAAVSTVKSAVVDDPLPALSLTFTVRVCSPLASACTSLAGSVTDQLPSLPTVAV
ncbi:Uncharacterised protein [Enterobacter hormaechei]|nr:Uncharacterised protein [Enterobacter hormaechei]CZU40752.1 Uncharacterised protein [Enterobacter hormaechei]CZV01554.1 Uncharacterised protein [Enterobacter hormaechei]CZV14131.1 Uncharacterised protein [Enterobacter hormaechei]CZW78703.1 Uncharacterised protein [Enterobacter hormaechei]